MTRRFLFLFAWILFQTAYSQGYDFIYQNFDRKDGLPSSEVYDIYEDYYGYIWVGTDRGIARFDGNEVIALSKEQGLTDPSTFQFKEISKDSVLGITASGNLYILNPLELTIQPFKFNEQILENKGTKALISNVCYDQKKWMISFLNFDKQIEISNEGVVNIIELEAYADSCALIDVYYDGKNYHLKRKIKRLPTEKGILRFRSDNIENQTRLNTFPVSLGYSYQIDSLYYQILNTEIYLFSPSGIQNVIKGDFEATSISRINDNDLWIGCRLEGVRQLNNLDQAFLNGYSVTRVIQDRNGGYWFSTLEQGIFYVKNPEVRSIQLPKKIRNISEIVNSDEAIFIGDIKGNIWERGNGSSQWKQLFSSVDQSEKRPAKLAYDHENEVLYAATCNQVGHYSKGQSFQLRPYPFYANRIKILDKRAYYFQKFAALYFPEDFRHFIRPDAAIYDVLLDVDVFIVCTDKGILLCKQEGNSTAEIVKLSELKLKRLYKIDQNYIGLNLENESVYLDKNFKKIDLEDDYWEILKLGNDFSLNNKKERPQLRPIFKSISDLNLNINTFQIIRDSLWIGLDTGLIVHTNIGSEIKSNYHLKLDSIVSKEFKWKAGDQIEIPWSQNSITIHYSGLGAYFGEKLKFRYRIRELNEDWHITEEKYANYSSLPGGEFTFEVEVYSSDKGWIQLQSIQFVQLIPFWKQVWFYIVFTLFSIVFIYFIIRFQFNQIRKKRMKEFKLQEMELIALKAQMNPHFTFNTINSIQYYLLKNDKRKSQDYLAKFARLIRNILDLSSEQVVPLEKDIEQLRLYIELEQLRFEDSFDYEISIDPNIKVDSMKIPPLLLQPFVENAIIHGLQPKKEKGNLLIDVQLRDGFFEVIVEDDGVGRNYKSKSKTKHKSKGIKITQERLELVNKLLNLKNQILITDLYNSKNEACGTRVTMKIKFDKDEEQPKNTDR